MANLPCVQRWCAPPRSVSAHATTNVTSSQNWEIAGSPVNLSLTGTVGERILKVIAGTIIRGWTKPTYGNDLGG